MDQPESGSPNRDALSPGPHGCGAPPEPIAIVGMALRLPGDVSSPTDFWRMIYNGQSGQSELPASRFNIGGFYHPNGANRAGSMVMNGGYFINEDLKAFDNAFFGINNLEATYMDPQQRKLLEVVFECFENAGIPLEKASGSNTGCFVGNFTIDFQVMQTKNIDEMHGYSATGMGTTILANRISHAFNLLGPSLVLDTACSSTLYCLHMACAALEARDCDAAIVAGSNLIQSPEQHIGTMKAGVLSPTSTCHTFDASADGYGRADGIGALYIKRLSDAMRDGDPIRSIIRATATNHNGRTQGITLPSSKGQIALMRKAYEKCGLSPEETAYVECHGTGTSVGDPIEVEAIGRFMGRSASDAVLIGGSKPNFGHSEAASGVTSIIKATLMLENSYIPPTIGIEELNPKIRNSKWGIKVVTEGQPWPESITLGSGQTTRRVGVNAFGYGGANAHAILEKKPRRLSEPSRDASHRAYFILPFSAATGLSLEARIKDFTHYNFASTSLENLAFTLGARRSHLAKRGFLVTRKSSFIHDISSRKLHTLGSDMPSSTRDLAFAFTGQGSQWKGMGKELFAEFPIFRDTIAELESFLRLLPHPPLWSLSALILGSNLAVEIAKPQYSQPACTAIQIGLVKLLASWGLNPSAVLGHSSGEIAAAYAAGYISATEAMRIAYYRGYVVEKYSTATGSMMAVNMSPASFNDYISTQKAQDISIACTNSPNIITLAGGSYDIDILQRDLQAKGVFVRKLQTGGIAYHSNRMLPLGERYEHLLEPITLCSMFDGTDTNCIWISSVTGNLMTAADIGPAYWRMNLEKPVEFAAAVSRLVSMKKYHFIEIGPHSTLKIPIQQTLETLGISTSEMPYCATIVRNENAVETVLSTAGNIFLQGQDVLFEKINGTSYSNEGKVSIRSPQVLVDLPRYRWTHTDQTLWNEPRESTEFRNRIHRRHELLGSVVPAGDGVDIRWKNIISLEETAWLNDHKLEGTVVFPAAAYIAMAIEAAKQTSETRKGMFYLRNFHILAALPIPLDSSAKLELLTTLKPTRISYTTHLKSSWDISVVSVVNQVSTVHVTGIVGIAAGRIKPTMTSAVSQQGLASMSPSVWYDTMAREGLNFGPRFRTIKDFKVDPSKALHYCYCLAPAPQDTSEEDYPIHPVTIDAALQASLVALTAGNPEALKAMVPTMIESASFSVHGSRAGVPLHIGSKAEISGFNRSVATSEVRGAMDRVVFQLDGVRLASYQAATDMIPNNTRHPMLRVLWQPDIEIGLQCASFSISQYLEASSTELCRDFEGEALRKLAGCVALFGHKNPYLRVLECRKRGQSMAKAMVKLLHGEGAFPRLWSYTVGQVDEDGVLKRSEVNIKTGEVSGVIPEDEETNYDLIIFLCYDGTDEFAGTVALGEKLIQPRGALLALLDGPLQIDLHKHKVIPISRIITDEQTQTIVAYRPTYTDLNPLQNHGNLYVACHEPSPLADAVSREMRTLLGRDPEIIKLEDIKGSILPSGAIVISLLELDKPMLTSISDQHMRSIQQITDKASTLVWVTGGSLFEGGSPSHSLAAGLARAVMLEQPALKFITFDVDNVSHDVACTARNIVHVLARSATSGFDSEFTQRSGIVHISRFVPDDGLNASFRQKQGSETQCLGLIEAKPVQLSIGSNHQLDSIFFKQISHPHGLGSTDVELEVEAVGLNAKDYYALTGKVDTRDATCTLEYGGVIRRIGSAVRDFIPGDRVIAMAPGKFKTHEIVPSWACQKLLPEEDMDIMCTLPVAYSTAIYALFSRANLQAGESVLIHSGAGGVGIAAIHMARQAQAEIFATVSTEEKKDYLVDTFGLKREHIFSSRDVSFVEGVMNATGGHGVDVVLNSLSGELLHASWKCCAEFGRFIEIGKRDMTEGGRLEMEQFLKSATFTGFDLSSLYYSEKPAHQKEWASLLAQVLQLYRQKKLIEFPLQRFDIQHTSNAFRAFGLTNRIGKIVVTMRNLESLLDVQLLRYKTEFSPFKSYLMVGCLGGLGRCISRWMMDRGARNFIFLGRSGTEKVEAHDLVNELEANGATCHVVRGDVCYLEDVKVMVEKAPLPIGGVIQAAMVLSETLFTNMSSAQWQKVIDPKVQGTWNLHDALLGKDGQLDFFLMLSSNSGSVGTATESNYCAGNYFLDVFARYRRSLGLPAVSLGLGMISEVGYLHENPHIGDLLVRRGVHPLPESELLIVIDIALSDQDQKPTTSKGNGYDSGAESHILTGLESVGLLKRRRGGFEDDDSALNDTRSRILLRALHNQRRINTVQEGSLPEEVLNLLEAGCSLADAVETHISRRFGNMTLTPYDKVDINKPLIDYGMDSMVGAELRSWLYRSLKVDIPFLDILGRSTTLSSLAVKVTEKVGHTS